MIACPFLTPAQLRAQGVPAARVNVLRAEENGVTTVRELSIIRTAARSRNVDTALTGLRALGRLERPDLLGDLMPALRHRFPEIRAEAAYAVGQAAQGWQQGRRSPGLTTPASLLETLADRLARDDDPSARAALGEAIGRLPYRSLDEVERAAEVLARLAASDEVADRLGSARAFDSLARRHDLGSREGPAVRALRQLAGLDGHVGDGTLASTSSAPDPLRDARVRRLAFEALIESKAVDAALVAHGASDADPQVRRLAMRAAAVLDGGRDTLIRGLDDPAPMVRLEALRSLETSTPDRPCAAALAATSDYNLHVALLAIDLLGACGNWSEAVVRLEHTVGELREPPSPREWHRAAHAIVALVEAAPERARMLLPDLARSTRWQVRLYGARAARRLQDAATLRMLARDSDDNVAATAIEGLSAVSGHADDALYVAALGRTTYQAVLAAGLALRGTPDVQIAEWALRTALDRLADEGHASSTRVRAALAQTLTHLGAPPPEEALTSIARDRSASLVNAATLTRLTGPLARVSIRGVGVIELALLPDEAPATVLRFAELAESGYYSGLTFHRVEPNLLVQGGSPGANDLAGYSIQMRDELGPWPHVRGTVGLWANGRDNGNAQFFINLVDNPRFDHRYTVFAQILNGIELIDQIREGDVIESVEIFP